MDQYYSEVFSNINLTHKKSLELINFILIIFKSISKTIFEQNSVSNKFRFIYTVAGQPGHDIQNKEPTRKIEHKILSSFKITKIS